MADNESKKTTYPKIPASNWWELRRRFQQSPPKAIGVDYLLSALGLSSERAAANLLSPLRTVGLIDENNNVTQRATIGGMMSRTRMSVVRSLKMSIRPR